MWKERARFLIFQTDVESEDKRIFEALGHVRMPCSMVKNQTTNELSLRSCSMLHFHDFNHMQINRILPLVCSICARVL